LDWGKILAPKKIPFTALAWPYADKLLFSKNSNLHKSAKLTFFRLEKMMIRFQVIF
jgi:hypothetical protein